MDTPEYQEFLKSKYIVFEHSGKIVSDKEINPILFQFQRDIVRWALRKGRCAIFADTGLGKTFMQLEFCRLVGGSSLIVAPLSVARQTVREAKKINLEINYTRYQEHVEPGINITNYEMIENFEPGEFDCIVLDESSILKSLDGKTRRKVTDMFEFTPYRLCCTATPAPNDISEIANHSEFLGVMSRADMLATFFVHDDDGYRLRGHGQDVFFRWLASWSISVRKPSDIGDYSDNGYVLPPLEILSQFVKSDFVPDGQLFFTGLSGIGGRLEARRETIEDRVIAAADLVKSTKDQWIIWCGLNDEQEEIEKLIPDCVSIYGSDTPENKARMIEEFQDGKKRVLITKPKIAGMGMNFQNARRMVFLGLSDSFETYYQCIRRCYRFGQDKPVFAHIVLSEAEDEIYQNVKRKEREADMMTSKLIENVQQFEKTELLSVEEVSNWEYKEQDTKGDNFTMMLGDSCQRMKEIESEIVDMSVYSPPFMSLYTYSPSERDLGNSKDEQEFFEHYGFIIRELLRITKPGRITVCHVAQVPAMMVRDGYIGLKDFRGKTIQAYIDNGWVYHGEVVIDKDPQAQAIRTKSKALLFTQMHKDSSWSRPALSDCILLFRKPGDNAVPITPDINNEQWIEWARPVWYGIRESDTLQYTTAREDKDERHICPLQLETIERCIRLWSNKGETIFSPFGGIGSEGYMALNLKRKFIGIELKESYYRVACRNLRDAEKTIETPALFDLATVS